MRINVFLDRDDIEEDSALSHQLEVIFMQIYVFAMSYNIYHSEFRLELLKPVLVRQKGAKASLVFLPMMKRYD